MDTKYKYKKLIERAIKRGKPARVFEKHHVIPQCFIKNDWTVNLTVPEHILAHKYLAEITRNPKLIQAYYLMINCRNCNIKISDVIKAREAFLANVEVITQPGRDAINKNLTSTFLKDRGKKIKYGKWGKVKLEYNNLCYYNKKHIAEDYNVSVRTITNWIKKEKIKVVQNKSITYDKQRRDDKSNA